jgi:putative membrane protein
MSLNEESQHDPADPRIYFAAERTLLAWVRTGMAMMGFGFVVARFGLFLREVASVRGAPVHQHSGVSLGLGTTLVIFGVLVNFYAAIRHWQTVRRLGRGETLHFDPWSLGTWAAIFMGLLGVATAAYLLFGLNEQQ